MTARLPLPAERTLEPVEGRTGTTWARRQPGRPAALDLVAGVTSGEVLDVEARLVRHRDDAGFPIDAELLAILDNRRDHPLTWVRLGRLDSGNGLPTPYRLEARWVAVRSQAAATIADPPRLILPDADHPSGQVLIPWSAWTDLTGRPLHQPVTTPPAATAPTPAPSLFD